MTVDTMYETLLLAQRMCNEALPKFNWGASALDANAIDLLNRGMLAIDAAVAAGKPEPKGEVCGACGKPWDGEKCAQSLNNWPTPVCYPVSAPRSTEQPAKRMPLTEEQRRETFRTSCGIALRNWGSWEWYLQGIEDAEDAHGIRSPE